MSQEQGPVPETVVYEHGKTFGFLLPAQHRAELSSDRRMVNLSTPDRGGTYEVDRVESVDDEFRIYLGTSRTGGHALGDLPFGYAFPEIQDELERLLAEYNELRGAHAGDAPVGWAQGASHDSYTTWLRAEIRRLRRGE
jgi:hypothetical protein